MEEDDDLSDDAKLFRQQMEQQGVQQLNESDQVWLDTHKPKPIPRQRYYDEQQVLQDMLSEHYDPSIWETGEELLFMRPGVQQSVMSKLRRGEYSVNAELDLHGLVVHEARQEVAQFLRDCLFHGVRCARIIHGKGYGSHQKIPILKSKLNHWLQQRDEVLAFCSARQVDGGTGAVYVLLKRLGAK